jgi:hypothetical protein
MAKITFNFEYALPDEYLHQTSEKGLKGSWEYSGPERMWVEVETATGRLVSEHGMVPDDGSEELRDYVKIKAGVPRTPVLVDARLEPLLAALFCRNPLSSTLPQKEYKVSGDDTVYYSRPLVTPPDHTYEMTEITYDFEKNQWNKPFPWKKPHINMEQLESARTAIIAGVTEDIANETDADKKAALEVFKAELEAVPTKFAGWDAWQIPFPYDPRVPNWDFDAAGTGPVTPEVPGITEEPSDE